MVKIRQPKANSTEDSTPSNAQIEAFASGAEGNVANTTTLALDPNEPRKFKTISVPFNEYEYEQLLKGANLAGRSKLNFMRYAMLSLAKELQE